MREIVGQKDLVDQEIALLHEQVNNINSQISAYNLLIADKQEQLTAAEENFAYLTEKNKERIQTMEEEGQMSYWSVLFQANSFSDLLDRLNMIEEIAASDRRRLEEMSQVAKEVEEAEQILLAERQELQKAKEEMAAVQQELADKRAEAEDLLRQLVEKGEEYDALKKEWEDKLEQQEIEMGKLEVEYDEALYKEHMATAIPSGNFKPGSNAGVGIAGEVKTDAGGIQWLVPCDYIKVASAFGWRTHPVYKDWRHHNGVDLAAWCLKKADGTTDSPIYASRAGVVVVSKYSSSSGWYVLIDHLDGYRSSYQHMCSKPLVNTGDFVTAGQVLGCIGTTGTSTNDHLHFAIYWQGNPINPMDHIG
jgi:murein DD-endopeptidase MepM/ murein hydrolase activator NlpD